MPEGTGERVRRLIREGAPPEEIQRARRAHGEKLKAQLDAIRRPQRVAVPEPTDGGPADREPWRRELIDQLLAMTPEEVERVMAYPYPAYTEADHARLTELAALVHQQRAERVDIPEDPDTADG